MLQVAGQPQGVVAGAEGQDGVVGHFLLVDFHHDAQVHAGPPVGLAGFVAPQAVHDPAVHYAAPARHFTKL
ncbi:hypothetical protein [Pseudarthrobacter cellobiosi]|uniref:hypothetical protein n=1 Tax=Pseudarthrobacter cellobiosi TaxID=2953654 RepID=UPI0035ABCDBC